jgi:hypothetical protein
MAVRLTTRTPRRLLNSFKRAIDDGHVKTWSYDEDGDFTHTSNELSRRAWFRPKVIENKELTLYILTPTDSKMTTELYASYHARLINALLRRFDGLFERACVSALPEDGDVVD